MWGRKGMEKLVGKSVNKLTKNISKEDFLLQLKEAWRPRVKKHTLIEDELAAAMERIEKSGPFRQAFANTGIVEDDIRTILEEIREEKVDPVRYEERKIGRNELCPCGSGLKYKRCCGK